jgi:uncharacterized membrane protein YeaQ/YmgE (transglycosylase-associated protein family)
MSIIAWIILGLIAGFIASKIVNKTGEDVLLDIVLGIVGPNVGGFLFTQFGAAGVSGLNLFRSQSLQHICRGNCRDRCVVDLPRSGWSPDRLTRVWRERCAPRLCGEPQA